MDPITKANHAKRLLEDDILKEAFAAVEKDIFEEWRMSAPTEYGARSDMFHTLKGLDDRPPRGRSCRRHRPSGRD